MGGSGTILSVIGRQECTRRHGLAPWRLLVGFWAASVLASHPVDAQSIDLRCWTIDDGLPQSVVSSLAEDAEGFVWVGTAGGLSRFDGERFSEPPLDLPSQRVYSIAQDRRGRVWAGSDRGLAMRDAGPGEVWRVVETKTPIDDARILAILDISPAEGPVRLLVGTRRAGLFELVSDDDGESMSARPLGDPSTIVGMAVLGDSVWVATDRGMLRLEGDRLDLPIWTGPLTEAPITAIATDGADRLLVHAAAGLYSIDTAGTIQPLGELAERVTAIAPGRDGRLWVGTHRDGLLRRELDGSATRVSTEEGLPAAGVRSLLAHSDGSLWIGTFGGGVCRLGSLAFAHFAARHGLPNEQVLGLAEGPPGQLWVGTLEGGLARWDGEAFQTFGREDGLRSPAVTHLAIDPEGTLWVATLRGGLHRASIFDATPRFVPVDPIDGLEAPLSIFHLDLDPDGSLWLSTWGDGLIHVPTGGRAARVWGADEGVGDGRVFSSSRSADGRRWISTLV